MSDKCHGFRSRIVDSFTGTLSEQDRRELQEHLSVCPPCRDYLQVMKREDASLAEYFAGIEENMANRQERALQMIERFDTNEETNTIWRRIMKSRYSKLATAAAILVLAAVALIVLDGSTSPAYAITDLPRQFEQARTIHVQGWNHFPGHTMPDGGKIPPTEINEWIDVENGRWRRSEVGLTVNDKDVRVAAGETVSDSRIEMSIDHTEKTVTYCRVSPYRQKLGMRQRSKLLAGQLFGDITQLSNSRVVGVEQIDGVTHDIWQSGDAHGWRWQQWLSANTGRLARAQVWREVAPGQWEIAADYQHIEYNAEVPEGVFAMDPPSGYTAANTPETAPFRELDDSYGGYTDEHYNLQCGAKIAFALADSSVILGWQSFDHESKEPPDVLFEDTTFGGPLPKLPVEFYALKPANESSDVIYTGYHLGQTHKDHRFIEWSLYVPNGEPPANIQTDGYTILYRWNLEFEPRWTMHVPVMPEFVVETAEEFDEWVLGAMAELSEDGKAPADVTYQEVIDLAQQVRTSVAP